jgi:acylphosphatase
VQGVFFRKYTSEKARSLGLRGYCENIEDGKAVVGELESESLEALNTMIRWLKETGSPKSRIDKLDLREIKTIEKGQFKSFDIRK